MPFVYESPKQPESRGSAPCCPADAQTVSGPCCDKKTGRTTADPDTLCCEAAQTEAKTPRSSCCS